MTHNSKLVAGILPLVVAVLLLIGSLVGQDDNFPFGPFRMYSTKQGIDGRIRILEVWGLREPGGAERLVMEEDFGLRRADLEGQLGKLEVPPTLVLERLADSYKTLHEGEFPFDGLAFRQRVVFLEDGVPAGEQRRGIATWRP